MTTQPQRRAARRSIQTTIALWAGVSLLAVALALVAYAGYSLRAQSLGAAREQMTALAAAEADKVDTELEVALGAARILAQTLAAVKDPNDPLPLTRQQVNHMIRQVTEDNPQFSGVYASWEPNAFDGRDAEYALIPAEEAFGRDRDGRFSPYYYRDASGQVTADLDTDYDYAEESADDYYRIPRETQREALIEPYLYPVGDKDVLMCTLAAPIVANGQFYGIVGVDITLDFLQTLADELTALNGQAKVEIISHGGVIAAATGRPELLGQAIQDAREEGDAALQIVTGGQLHYASDGETESVYAPIRVADTRAPWAANVYAPTRALTAQAERAMLRMAGVAALPVLVGLALVIYASRRIARPIRQISDVARQIASGDLTQAIAVRGDDEVG